MNLKTPRDPQSNVTKFMRGRNDASTRNASYDHCFNYFREHFERHQVNDLADGAQLQVSCLHLGYYLASWGMFRGKAKLLQHSSAALVPVIELISKAPKAIWMLDVSDYDEVSIRQILEFKHTLGETVPGGRSGTLTSKIMLGVFGCVPAFDRYFREGSGLSKFDENSLLKIRDYYRGNQDLIERCRSKTLGFDGRVLERRYTQAKVIDMIFFIEGSK
jgi:hypothetical protein